MSFFNVVNFTMSGYLRSNGEYYVRGQISFNFDLGIIRLSTSAWIEFSNTRIAGGARGTLSVHIPFWPVDIDFDLASISIRFEVRLDRGEVFAEICVGVPIIGEVCGDVTWSWGKPPILATKIGSVLRINMGKDAGERKYVNTTDDAENFTIAHSGGSAGNESIEVSGVGYKQTYSGVSKVLINNAGNGDDVIRLYGIRSPVEIHGGVGNDRIEMNGPGNALIYGDAGNDYIQGGDGDDEIHGGDGSDTLRGGKGNDTIYGDAGNDLIQGEDGDDVIEGGTGNDALQGGKGNDRYVFKTGWGSDLVTETGTDNDDVFDFSALGTSVTFTLGADNSYVGSVGNNSVTD